MSDTLSLMYPTMAQTTAPAATPAGASAPPLDDEPDPAAAAAEVLYPSGNSKPSQAAAELSASPAELLYEPTAETITPVRWTEPPSSAAELERALPDGDGAIDRTSLANILAERGVGATLAAEIYTRAADATKPGYVKPDRATTEAALRREWGAQYDARVSQVQQAVALAARRDPSVVRILDTGLGNDLNFVKILSAKLRRR